MTIPSSAEPQRLTFTPAEACTLLGLSRRAMSTLLREGTLYSIQVGRKRLIPRQALVEFVACPPHPLLLQMDPLPVT